MNETIYRTDRYDAQVKRYGFKGQWQGIVYDMEATTGCVSFRTIPISGKGCKLRCRAAVEEWLDANVPNWNANPNA